MADSVVKQIEDQMIADIEAGLSNNANAMAGPLRDVRGLGVFVTIQGGRPLDESYGALDMTQYALLTVVSKDIEKVRLALQELMVLWMPAGASTPLQNLRDIGSGVFVERVTQFQEPVEWASGFTPEGRIELELQIRYPF